MYLRALSLISLYCGPCFSYSLPQGSLSSYQPNYYHDKTGYLVKEENWEWQGNLSRIRAYHDFDLYLAGYRVSLDSEESEEQIKNRLKSYKLYLPPTDFDLSDSSPQILDIYLTQNKAGFGNIINSYIAIIKTTPTHKPSFDISTEAIKNDFLSPLFSEEALCDGFNENSFCDWVFDIGFKYKKNERGEYYINSNIELGALTFFPLDYCHESKHNYPASRINGFCTRRVDSDGQQWLPNKNMDTNTYSKKTFSDRRNSDILVESLPGRVIVFHKVSSGASSPTILGIHSGNIENTFYGYSNLEEDWDPDTGKGQVFKSPIPFYAQTGLIKSRHSGIPGGFITDNAGFDGRLFIWTSDFRRSPYMYQYIPKDGTRWSKKPVGVCYFFDDDLYATYDPETQKCGTYTDQEKAFYFISGAPQHRYHHFIPYIATMSHESFLKYSADIPVPIGKDPIYQSTATRNSPCIVPHNYIFPEYMSAFIGTVEPYSDTCEYQNPYTKKWTKKKRFFVLSYLPRNEISLLPATTDRTTETTTPLLLSTLLTTTMAVPHQTTPKPTQKLLNERKKKKGKRKKKTSFWNSEAYWRAYFNAIPLMK